MGPSLTLDGSVLEAEWDGYFVDGAVGVLGIQQGVDWRHMRLLCRSNYNAVAWSTT
ncbi:hypothetical protein [Mycobacterium leprae]|uniref:hypothetical protein n=1 Tax=Mycobacterium leprae TaxID=1769 RepID=UPI000B031220|nr:hypothetical protein [Mycobacterium leprae]